MDKQQKARRKLSRREFLKVGTAGLGVAALGSLPGKVFGQAPAALKGTKLTILQGTYFIGPGQDLYKKQATDWGKENGVDVSADFLNWPDLQPKIAAAIQAGGVDIVELWPSWNHLYKDSLVDMTPEAEEFGKRGGGYEKYVLNSAPVNGRYLGIPHGMSNASMNYRISWLKEAGCPNAEDGSKVDLTWDEYHAIAKKCKAAGHPFGQALGHSTGDPPGFVYPYMWAHGAMEVDKEGKSIQFNKPSLAEIRLVAKLPAVLRRHRSFQSFQDRIRYCHLIAEVFGAIEHRYTRALADEFVMCGFIDILKSAPTAYVIYQNGAIVGLVYDVRQ